MSARITSILLSIAITYAQPVIYQTITTGSLWRADRTYKPSYSTDGFMVSLSGKIEWSSSGIFGDGSQHGTNGYIATLPEEIRPRYNSVFVVTNDKGLTCSVEIQHDTGYLILKAWSWPLIYYQT
eukprot:312014_1